LSSLVDVRLVNRNDGLIDCLKIHRNTVKPITKYLQMKGDDVVFLDDVLYVYYDGDSKVEEEF